MWYIYIYFVITRSGDFIILKARYNNIFAKKNNSVHMIDCCINVSDTCGDDKFEEERLQMLPQLWKWKSQWTFSTVHVGLEEAWRRDLYSVQ